MEAELRTSNNISENKVSTFFQERLFQREVECKLTDNDIVGLERSELYSRIEKSIGNTSIKKIKLPNGNLIIQKNETGNPTETHYDRCYVELLRNLEDRGVIKPGDVLLETTSGSAGVSFSWICKKLGYDSVVFMPAIVPEARIFEVKKLATSVHLNHDESLYLLGCAQDMKKYYQKNSPRVKAAGKNMYMPNHSQDSLTPKIFAKIMDEVVFELNNLRIDYFVGGIGNGSTLLGVGERLKEINPDSKIIAFEPVSACPFFKKYQERWGNVGPKLVDDSDVPDGYSFHRLPGTGSFGNVDFPFMDVAMEKDIIADICPVPDGAILDTVTYNDELEEQDKLGNSSLVSRYIAEALSGKVRNSTILILAYDKADRYGTPRYI